MSSTELLHRMSDPDQDIRFMALNDLYNGFNAGRYAADDSMLNRFIDAVLKALEDHNGEVQNMAVRCLAPLLRRGRDSHIQLVIDRLSKGTGQTSQQELRNISPIALRTVITEVPPNSPIAGNITRRLVPKLLPTLTQLASAESSDQLLDALDVVAELCGRFSGSIVALPESQQHDLTVILQRLLDHPRLAVRKRSSTALGALSSSILSELFSALVSQLLEALPLAKSDDKLKTVFGVFGQICEVSTDGRFDPYVQTIAPAVFDALAIDDDELREVALQTLEIFALHAPTQLRRYQDKVIELALQYLSYDPNYVEQDGEGDDDDDMDDADDMSDLGSDFAEDDYSDDEDMSWKVRRASAKLIASLLSDRNSNVAAVVASPLVTRFNEREETVQVEVLQAYRRLISKRLHGSTLATASRKRPRSADEMDVDSADAIASTLPKALSKLVKLLGSKSQNVKLASSQLLRSIAATGFSLADVEAAVLKSASSTLFATDSSAAAVGQKIQLLAFFQTWLSSPSITSSTAAELTSMLTRMVEQESSLKVAAAAVDASESAVLTRPASENLVNALIGRLSNAATDQDVREKCLHVLGLAVAQDGVPTAVASRGRAAILEKIANEALRSSAVSALEIAGRSGFSDEAFAQQTLTTLTPLLGIGSKSARITIFDVLANAIASATASGATATNIAQQIASICYAEDVQLIPSALKALLALLNSTDDPRPIADVSIRAALKAVSSSTDTTNEIVNAFQILSQRAALPADAAELVTPLRTQSPAVAARILAATIPDVSSSTFIQLVGAAKTSEEDRVFAIQVVGECSRLRPATQQVAKLLLESFGSPSDAVKAASSSAYGNVVAGDPDTYAASLTRELPQATGDDYLTTVALRQAIVSATDQQLIAPTFSSLWDQLFTLANANDRAVPVAAEAIGQLVLVRPQQQLDLLQRKLEDSSASTNEKATVLRAVRYILSDTTHQPHGGITDGQGSLDVLLRSSTASFIIGPLTNGDLRLRRLALGLLYTASHNRPDVIRDHIDLLLPALIGETYKRDELVHIVQMGPFKHTVDDGLETRKAAFETLLSLLDSQSSVCLFDRTSSAHTASTIVHTIGRGLSDPASEIKLLNHLNLIQVCELASPIDSPYRRILLDGISTELVAITEGLKMTVFAKVKESAVKGEREKDEELKRSGTKAAARLHRLLHNNHTQDWLKFIDEAQKARPADFQPQIVS
ncbi:hypothetical protein PYCC9005_004757 [Savitreella phatthalungensis]